MYSFLQDSHKNSLETNVKMKKKKFLDFNLCD